MDDFNVSALHESKNEWGSRLLTILTPLVVDGYKSILEEAVKMCKENNEMDKYLMTFQNFISRIPKWNPTIIETERERICKKSGCAYLEDLVTCVHIIQIKVLTAVRVGQKQKKIDINIPKFNDFIHKVYINVARKIYKNVYLFELNIQPLQMQKNNRELEILIQEAILNTLRESIPVESILKVYMDETMEEDVIEEIKEQIIDEPLERSELANTNTTDILDNSKLSFSDIDHVKDYNNNIVTVTASKDINRLEEISELRNQQRKELEDADDDDDDNEKIKISDQPFEITNLDIHSIEEPKIELEFPDLLQDIEILDDF